MNDASDSSIVEYTLNAIIKYSPSLEGMYFISQIISAAAIIAGSYFTVQNLRIARKTLRQIKIINKANNQIQRNYALQSRLTELSHEWNSRDFVEARNKASIVLRNIDKDDVDVFGDLVFHNRIDDWVYISMVAHFFIRLSTIQESEQIDKDHAQAEFQEAVAYWIKPLLRAYKHAPTEKRLRKALIRIHNRYNPDTPHPDDSE